MRGLLGAEAFRWRTRALGIQRLGAVVQATPEPGMWIFPDPGLNPRP